MLSAFLSGLTGSVLVPAHLLAVMGVGLSIGRSGARLMTTCVFALGLAAGLIAIAWAVGDTAALTLILTAAFLAGLTVAIGRDVHWLLLAPLAAVTGVGIGLNSPPETVIIAHANAALIGTAMGGVLAVLLVSEITSRLRGRWQGIAVRIAGSWIAASAALALAFRLAS